MRTRLICLANLLVFVMSATAHAQSPTVDHQALDQARSAVAQLLAEQTLPTFAAWIDRDELMIRTISPGAKTDTVTENIPLISRVHFDPAMAEYIRQQSLEQSDTLAQRHSEGETRIAALPEGTRAAMTAWWPIAATGLTAMPIWDAQGTARPHSNGYLSWPDLIAINPEPAEQTTHTTTAAVVLAGRRMAKARIVPLDRFANLRLDTADLSRLSGDANASRLARMVLGRPLQVGDHLALVAMHLMRWQAPSGLWTTLWWDDQSIALAGAATHGLFANYRMNAGIDAMTPLERDGRPPIVFNPWLDGGLVDAGDGHSNGVQSNCISCHARAAWPVNEPLRVTRGSTAPKPGSVATAMLWSVALHGRAMP